MSAGKCKRGPENPLGVTSSSSSSDDDSPRRDVVDGVSQLQHQQPTQLDSLSPAPASAAHNSGLPATLPIGSTTAQQDFDTTGPDYDAASSPSGSSTLSGGPVYVRKPGFTDHAHSHRVVQSVRRPRSKKKKNAVSGIAGATTENDDAEDYMVTTLPLPSSTTLTGGASVAVTGNSVESFSRQHVVRPSGTTRSKTHRDPIPMRMRALPQSMWQEPNIPHNVSPATVYPILPPLVTREGDDISSLRPVTPPDDRDDVVSRPERQLTKSITTKVHGTELRRHQQQNGRLQQLQPGERIVSVARPELLQQLFDVLKEPTSKSGHRSFSNHAKKTSSNKKVIVAPHFKTSFLTGQDPCMVDNIADTLFPQLCLERGGAINAGASTARLSGAYGSGTMMVHLQPLPVGDKTIMLPALSVDQNYPQMLSELVANM